MFTMENQRVLILIAILSSLFVEEIDSCFTYNEMHKVLVKSMDSWYEECVCEQPVLTTRNMKWLDNSNESILENGTKVFTTWERNRTLSVQIPNLTKAMTGMYKCVSVGVDGRNYTISYDLEVYDEVRFIQTNETQYLIKGQDSIIRCNAVGHKRPVFTWYRVKDDVMITDDEKYVVAPGALIIRNASKEDAGKYRCTVRVAYTGEDLDKILEVQVMTAPIVADIIAVPDEVVLVGDPLTLDCKANGYPLPTYAWRKISNQTEVRNKTWSQDFNKIVFDNITLDDQGTYECIAHNNAGDATKTIDIEVLAAPIIEYFENITISEGNMVTISCDTTGRPQPHINVTFYGPGGEGPPGYNKTSEDPSSTRMTLNLTFEKVEKYHEGWYDCNASNIVGSELKSMYLKVLYKPFFEKSEEVVWAWDDKNVNLSCEHYSAPDANVIWSYQGNNNDIPNQVEVIQFWMAKLSKTTEPFIAFTPIRNMLYGIYECVAKNVLGEAKKIINVKRGYHPSQIKQVNITDLAATSVTFEIEVPTAYIGPEPSGYTAEYDEAENYNITDIHLNRTWASYVPFKIDKLKPVTKYKIRFAAINDIGYGPYGQYYNFETPEKSAPEPPSWDYNAESVVISDSNRILKLKTPEHNGDPIDYYAIKYCPVDDSTVCVEQRVPPTTELELLELNQNTSYRVQMIAHNSVGNSTPTSLQITMAATIIQEDTLLSGGAIIALSIVAVILVILLLDLLLFFTRKQGMIANCYNKKNNKKKNKEGLQSKDKKGLLKDNGESGDTLKRTDNGHKEFEYNKTTGIITGKHSAV